MGESVPVRCPECLRTQAYAPPAFPCACGRPVAPAVAADGLVEPITHRNWADTWVTVRCGACGHATDWPHPELGCPCGTVLRIPVRRADEGGTGPEPATGRDEADGGAVPDGPAGTGGAMAGTLGSRPEGPEAVGGDVTRTGGGSEAGREPGAPTPFPVVSSPPPTTPAPPPSRETPGTPPEQGPDAGTRPEQGPGIRLPSEAQPDGSSPPPAAPGSPWFGPGPGARGGAAGTPGPGADGGGAGPGRLGADPTADPGTGATGGGAGAGAGSGGAGSGGAESDGPRTFAERYPPHIPLPVTAPRPEPRRGAFRPVTIRTSRDAVAAAAGYLRWLGYRDVVQPEERPASGVDLRAPGLIAQVDPSTRPAGLRAVECLWLNGLTSAAVSVFFSLAGYTPEARSRAAEIGLPLFVLDLTGTPQPVNHAAEELAAGGA
ncbi:hypothetical protein ACIQ62_21705 [Streptomyces sp. NPDC096319]|uniref:hypothetical protein n=1 Tax=Streptomyces sp. NPDC096319 TaxID=3366084 RepID=UPI0037F4A785